MLSELILAEGCFVQFCASLKNRQIGGTNHEAFKRSVCSQNVKGLLFDFKDWTP